MRILQDVLDKALHGVPEHFVAQLISQKLAAQRITLSEPEYQLLTEHIGQGKETFSFQRLQPSVDQHVTVEFTQEDLKQMEGKFADFLENKLPSLIETVAEDTAQSLLASLKRKWPAESRLQHRELGDFRKRLCTQWREPIESLRMLLTIAREFGGSNYGDIQQCSNNSERTHLVDVLIRSHARACQIGEEILCLLEGGFPDGAMARWRTLHELGVVASFIASHGEDLAERYVLHQAVESKRAQDAYAKCQERLGYEPLGEADIERVKTSFDAVVARFGPEFCKGDYGWAAHHLGIPKPNFVDIECAVGVDHLRSHYRMASYNVHANPRGVFFRLGILDESQIILAGASNVGLVEPGQCAALSLLFASSALGSLQESFDNAVVLKMMHQLVGEVAEGFVRTHDDFAEKAAKQST